ncbi:MAG TPA: homocysteine S-methyltransferase family protein [Alphaproteobacteria bacterium]|nr:homocysteine S-methyltransferase family protein [Alphaproteobacteria bacterium]
MMRYARLKERLTAGEIIVLDGPTGTELERRGAPMDPNAWCGPATLDNDRLLTEIHADYIGAGADVITANTFATSRLMLARAGLAGRVSEINQRAVAAALRARDTESDGAAVVVAGSLSHMVPIGQGTEVQNPAELPSDAEIEDALYELAGILAGNGCELIILEMMYHPARIRAAVDAARATKLPVWFGASARRGQDGSPISFHKLNEIPLDSVAAMIPTSGIDAAGIMHTGAELTGEALQVVRRHFGGPLMAYPDSGYFEMPNWRFVDVITPERFEQFCRDWIASGVQIIGGCCGLTPDHIRAAVRAQS